MKKYYMFILILSIRCLYAFDPIADLRYANDIIKMNQILIKIEFSDILLQNELDEVLEYWNVDNIISVYIKNYFIYSQNENVKNYIKDYIEKKDINDNYSETILSKYSLTKTENENSPEGFYFKNDKEITDENINYTFLIRSLYFDNSLLPVYPWNDYIEFSVSDNNDTNKNENKVFIVGGGTNTITIFLDKYVKANENKFQELSEAELLKSKYSSYYEKDVSDILYNSSKIEKAVYFYAFGPDRYFSETIQNADFYLIIQDIEGYTYKINYFMNISNINNNYSIRKDLWRLMNLYCLMTVLND